MIAICAIPDYSTWVGGRNLWTTCSWSLYFAAPWITGWHPYNRSRSCYPAAPLRMLGHQPIQNNVAPTHTMFVIFIDLFCCNQTLLLRNNVKYHHV